MAKVLKNKTLIIGLVILIVVLLKWKGIYLYSSSMVAPSLRKGAVILNVEDYENELNMKFNDDYIEFSFGDLLLNLDSKYLKRVSYNYERNPYKHIQVGFRYANYDLKIFAANFLINGLQNENLEHSKLFRNRLDFYDFLSEETHTYSSRGYGWQSDIAQLRPLSLKQMFFASNLELENYKRDFKVKKKLFPSNRTYLLENNKNRMIISGPIKMPNSLDGSGELGQRYEYIQYDFSGNPDYYIHLFDKTDSVSHFICFRPKYTIKSEEDVLRQILRILAGFNFQNTKLTLDSWENWSTEFNDSLDELKNLGIPVSESIFLYNPIKAINVLTSPSSSQ